jgi:hypothetical protein
MAAETLPIIEIEIDPVAGAFRICDRETEGPSKLHIVDEVPTRFPRERENVLLPKILCATRQKVEVSDTHRVEGKAVPPKLNDVLCAAQPIDLPYTVSFCDAVAIILVFLWVLKENKSAEKKQEREPCTFTKVTRKPILAVQLRPEPHCKAESEIQAVASHIEKPSLPENE